MEQVFEKAAGLLRAGQSFVLAALCESRGSTPRSDGAKMIVISDGSVF